jgi:hypothetical protein
MTNELVLADTGGAERIRIGEIEETSTPATGKPGVNPGSAAVISADYWGIRIKNALGANVVEIGREGAHQVQQAVTPPTSDLAIGGGGAVGELLLRDQDQHEVFRISAATGAISAGSNNKDGSLRLKDSSGKDAMLLDAKDRSISIRDASGNELLSVNTDAVKGTAGLMVGVHKVGGTPGWVAIRDQGGNDSIYLDGKDALISVRDSAGQEMFGFNPGAVKGTAGLMVGVYGANGDTPGWIAIRNTGGKDSIYLDGGKSQISIRDQAGNESIRIDGNDADIWLRNTIHIDGGNGDIVLQNADCAEEFEFAPGADIDAGSVVVIDDKGRLEMSRRPYDRTVAGVVSGAGDCRPALVLDRKPGQSDRVPVALLGKVYCKVDARCAAVQVGDLLTTSSTPGHAMKATDPTKAFGAVLGKALRRLDTDTGMIPVLVALQ